MPNKFYQVKSGKLAVEFDKKTAVEIKNGEKIIDYQNVIIKGYLSTFVTKTLADRIGDYVLPGAFTDTLKTFFKNPVSLIDHENKVFSIAGQFLSAEEDKEGLAVEIKITDAPDMAGLRIRIVERSVRTLSMGGLFYYLDDGRGIYKVDLFEGSIVAVPMNQDAIFSARSLTLPEFKSVLAIANAENAASELLQSTIAGRVVGKELIQDAVNLMGGNKSVITPQRKLFSVGGIKIRKGIKS